MKIFSVVLFWFLFTTVPSLCLKLNSTLFDGCSVSKTCVFSIPGSCSQVCTPDTCKLLFVIENIPTENKLRIGLHSVGNYGYMAIGFSGDNFMPNTDVIGCQKSDADNAHVKDTFNILYSNSHDNDDSAIEINNDTVWISGDAFSCIFTRTYQPQDSSRGFTLNVGKYHVFLAVGAPGLYETPSVALQKHASTPCKAGPVDLLGPATVTTGGTDYTLVRAHGMLMLLAWSVFIATGVFFAAYGKSLFPNAEWFFAHKFINLSALLIALIGIILIFVSVRGWKIEPVGSDAWGILWAHQLIGLASVLIMVVNVILAAFRCRPAARFRWIYRLVHGGLGFTGMIMATVAIAFGLFLYYRLIGKDIGKAYGLWIFIGRVVTEWFFHIPLIIYMVIKGIQLRKKEKYEKNEKIPLPEENPFKIFLHNIFGLPTCPRGEKRKKPRSDWPVLALALVAFIVYVLVFYVATVVAVALSELI